MKKTIIAVLFVVLFGVGIGDAAEPFKPTYDDLIMTSWIYTDSHGYNNEIWLVPPGKIGGPVQAKYHLWWRIKENRIGPWTYDGNVLILSEPNGYWNDFTPVVAGVPTMVDCDEEIDDGSSPYYKKCIGRSVKRFIMVIKNDSGREWVFKFKAFKKFID